MKKVTILGVTVHECSLQELLENVSSFIRTQKKKKVMYANIHVINTAQYDTTLKKNLNSSDIVYCDGSGIRLGAKILGESLPERMTGADWIYDLCSMAETHNYSLYLLGAEPGIPEKAEKVLTAKYPRLKIAGFHHGYFDCNGDENNKILQDINAKKPDILLVGFGSPLQEKWIDTNRDNLDTPVVWAVGAVMDFVASKVKRAPAFMLENHMEWLYRLYQEPGRMWKRYIIGNTVFILKVLIKRCQTFFYVSK